MENGKKDGSASLIMDTRRVIRDSYKAERYREAVELIEGLVEVDAWLLKYLGKAKIRLGDLNGGLLAIMDAMSISKNSDVELWLALAEIFERTDKPACAAECYKTAATFNNRQGHRCERKASKCLRIKTSPEDIAVSRVFFRASRDSAPLSQMVEEAKNSIDASLYRPRWASNETTFLHVLRGHSSFTPIIEGSGGGYLLMHHGRGCVIDPGHNFVRNFLERGYGFGDIHAVIVTHAHDDHMMDLPAIASVLSKAGLRRKVDLYLDETSYMALRGHYLLASSGFRLRRPILKAWQRGRKLFTDSDYSLRMDVYETRHDVPVLTSVKRPKPDRVKTKCGVGLGFRIGFTGGMSHYLLMPSDTGWRTRLHSQYRKLRDGDVAVVHISSIKDEIEWVYSSSNEERYLDPRHMGLLGVIGFIREMRPRHVILSEKGAELDGIWQELADSIQAAFVDEDIIVCASEIGTMVTFDGERVKITGS